jgi:ADP-ribosylglycohydrolase
MKWANKSIDGTQLPSPFMGKNTRNLFCGVRTVHGYENRYNKIFTPDSIDEWSQSNGSLMRCMPLSFVSNNSVVIDCSITNPHPVNIECCQVYTSLIAGMVNDPTFDVNTFIKYSAKYAKEKSVKDAIQDALTLTHRNISGRDKGWAPHALYATLYCAKRFGHDENSIQKTCNWVIHNNRGCDTDTVAAIACGAIGAWCGKNTIMKNADIATVWDTIMQADTTQGDFPRPRQYTLHDFDMLTQRFANAV